VRTTLFTSAPDGVDESNFGARSPLTRLTAREYFAALQASERHILVIFRNISELRMHGVLSRPARTCDSETWLSGGSQDKKWIETSEASEVRVCSIHGRDEKYIKGEVWTI
jgi:hypothetical protein